MRSKLKNGILSTVISLYKPRSYSFYISMHHVFVQISPTIGIVKHICSSFLCDHYTFVDCFPSSSSKGRKCTDHANFYKTCFSLLFFCFHIITFSIVQSWFLFSDSDTRNNSKSSPVLDLQRSNLFHLLKSGFKQWIKSCGKQICIR